jgi:hypothetical protein
VCSVLYADRLGKTPSVFAVLTYLITLSEIKLRKASSQLDSRLQRTLEVMGMYVVLYVCIRHSCLLVRFRIGKIFHAPPNIYHHRNRIRAGNMQVGHIFTIEPIICAGRGGFDCSDTWPDGWTEVCKDKMPSAQFEHTLLITPDGVEALTAKLPASPPYCV